MRVLTFQRNFAKLLVQNQEDLWHLSAILEEGDLVEGKTYRKVKIGSDDKNQDSVKKPVFLKIDVERVEFHKYSNILRVSGKVAEGQDEIPKGSYHTFSVEPGTEIGITKQEWLNYHKKRLDEAKKERKSDVLICAFDREEATIALVKQQGFDVVAELKGDVEKKAFKQNTKDFYDEVLKVIKEYTERHGIKNVILASPAFWKDEFNKRLKDPELKKKIVFTNCSGADSNVINEVLRRPEVQNILSEESALQDIKAVDELMALISKAGPVTYGIQETAKAVELGAIKTLLLTDGLMLGSRMKNEFQPIYSLMKKADAMGADIRIISSDNDGGKRLDGLGGIAAILRFKIE